MTSIHSLNPLTTYNDLLSEFAQSYVEECQASVINSSKANFKKLTGFGINTLVTPDNLEIAKAALKPQKLPLTHFGEWMVKEVVFYGGFEYGVTGVSEDLAVEEPETQTIDLVQEVIDSLDSVYSISLYSHDLHEEERRVTFYKRSGGWGMRVNGEDSYELTQDRQNQYIQYYVARGYTTTPPDYDGRYEADEHPLKS